MTQFQCNTCQFQNCQRRNLREGNKKDELFLLSIRRAKLDALRSREASTVQTNWYISAQQQEYGNSLGFDQILPVIGPHPIEDRQGMKVATTVLLKSQAKGKTLRQYNMIQQEHCVQHIQEPGM